ncbi:MAG: hypothetical protein K2Y71_27445 [Xanthobacteraceae bacterium]|nr:hypothetical protein [Xanthobacteraceae bacterium]
MIAAGIAGFVALDLAHAQPVDELIKHVPGDGDVVVRRLDDVSPLVIDALKEPFGCRPAARGLSELGIITFQATPGFLPMTLVPCESIVPRSVVFLFDRGLSNPPRMMKFPHRLFVWNAKSKELVGYAISDMISTPWYVGRSIYRHVGGGGELNGFALVAQERGEMTKDGLKNWQPIETAQPSDIRR